MAHLVRCWCGKRYRCDIEHPPLNGRLICFEDSHERNCPDEIIHSNRQSIRFEKLSIPLILKGLDL